MTGSNHNFAGGNAVADFWADFVGKMAASGMSPMQAPADMPERMRRAYFDSMAQSLDDFMRSEAFLTSMKQSMDQALALQQMVNQSLQRGLAAAQMPSREDVDHLVELVRGMEERLLKRLNQLEERLERMEKPEGAAAGRAKGRASGAAKA